MLNLYFWIAQTSAGGTPPVDPGNDPLLTIVATIVFAVVSIGTGMLAFKFYNRPPKS
jgi:hypothetical protein